MEEVFLACKGRKIPGRWADEVGGGPGVAGPEGLVAVLRLGARPVGGLEHGRDLVRPLEQPQRLRRINPLLLRCMRRPLPPPHRLILHTSTNE